MQHSGTGDTVVGSVGHNARGRCRRSGSEPHARPRALDERRDGRAYDIELASRSDRWHALHVERWHGRKWVWGDGELKDR